MKNKALTILLVLIFAGSLGMFAYSRLEAKKSLEAQQQAEEMAKETVIQPAEEEVPSGWQELPIEDDPYMDALAETDLEALRAVNPDVLGWIEIPETQLKYPLMKGLDNQYYLNHSWNGKANQAGAIFLERMNQEDFSDFHTVIYGHRQLDGSMFGSLKHYTTTGYWQEHPYVYIKDDAGVHRYEIFAAYEAAVGSRTYQVGFADENSKQNFLEYCAEASVIDTGVMPTLEDKILTLSTCTAAGDNANRWVVQARLQGVVK